jgi:hypothetical protein
MKGLLSMVAGVCVVALIGLSILPGSLYQFRPVGITGTHGVLVPAGDDGPGGH